MNLPSCEHCALKVMELTVCEEALRVVTGVPAAATAVKGREVPDAYVVVLLVGVKTRLVVLPTVH